MALVGFIPETRAIYVPKKETGGSLFCLFVFCLSPFLLFFFFGICVTRIGEKGMSWSQESAAEVGDQRAAERRHEGGPAEGRGGGHHVPWPPRDPRAKPAGVGQVA